MLSMSENTTPLCTHRHLSHDHIVISIPTRMHYHTKPLPRNPLVHRLPIRMVANLHISSVLVFNTLLLVTAIPQTGRSSINRLNGRSRLELRRACGLVAIHDVRLGIAHVMSRWLAGCNRSSSHPRCRWPRWLAGLTDGRDAWWFDVRVEDWILCFVTLARGGFFFRKAGWVLGAVDLLCVGVGWWRDSPELQEAKSLVKIGVGVKMELVRQER